MKSSVPLPSLVRRAVLLGGLLAALSLAAVAPAQEQAVAPPAEATAPDAAASDAAASDAAAPEAAAPDAAPPAEESVEIALPLIERPPFDRVTLDAANGNAVIETVLLDLPDRRVPDPLPDSGKLTIYRLSSPSIPYDVQWSAVAKVELYEQMLLDEAVRLTTAGDFAGAFDYLAALSLNYPQLAGLEPVRQQHLWREASALYSAGKHDEAWSVLVALYQRNPQFPRLVNAVQAVADSLIGQHLKSKNYAAAGALLDAIERSFPKLQVPSVARWRQRFQADADEQLAKAREALAAKRYSAARDAVNYALAILPGAPGGAELWREIQAAAPEVRVGVTQGGGPGSMDRTPDWATARSGELLNPRLVQMVDFSGEGGVYASPWSEITHSASGLETTVRYSPDAVRRGLKPGSLAVNLVEIASAGSPQYQADLAGLLKSVAIVDGQDVKIAWQRPHIRPESLLQIPLRWLVSAADAGGLWFDLQAPEEESLQPQLRYGREAVAGELASVVEMVYPDDEAALAALVRGDVDVIDRVPPWQLQRARADDKITVAPYRLPTVHALVPNLQNPLLEVREFRRAICYAIDAQRIVADILLGGQSQPGYRTLSGPFPAGTSLNDPVGYAYNTEVAPRPYEPRLAALLATVARTTLAKREAAMKKERDDAKLAADKKKAEAEGKDKDAAQDAPSDAAKPADEPAEAKPKLPPLKPLVLLHPADPIARLACESIKIQLDLVGIPIKLVEAPAIPTGEPLEYDLLYVELAIDEPINDARRLLGPRGVAASPSALLGNALDKLDRAQNWNQARAQLKEIHRIAYYDLPLIPLWQTVNYFAYRKSLEGVGPQPVRLYQDVAAWRRTAE